MSVSSKHCGILEAVGVSVDLEWDKSAAFIAGKVGYEAMHIQSVRMSHPPFPIFCYGLASTAALSNGALLKIFDSYDPVGCVILNVNHSQTRKSRLTAFAEKLLMQEDTVTVARLNKIWSEKMEGGKHNTEAGSTSRRRT